MAGCCKPRGYERLFNARVARRDAERYRRRGLGRTSSALVRLAGDVDGATILDVGGGIGGIELELLAAGAARATNIELSGEYEDAAAQLVAELGLAQRVDRRVADFVTVPVEPHDVVILHRVVCCYPDVDALVGTAAATTRGRLLLTYPQERPWTRLGVRIVNVGLRLSRSTFRTYVHPVNRIVAAAAAKGLDLEQRERHGLLWESAAFGRPE